MPRVLLLLLLSMGCVSSSAGVNPDSGNGGGSGGGSGGGGRDAGRMTFDAGPYMSGCKADTECPTGMICEGCTGGVFSCVPGCRDDAACKAFQLCNHDVACATCPCPSGFCEQNPCLDLDNDGYVQACDNDRTVCAGKKQCDCDDLNAEVKPGAKEICSDNKDNDCDNKWDRSDEECQTCANLKPACGNNFQCSIGNELCSARCCVSCPAPVIPTCLAGELQQVAVDTATGCRAYSCAPMKTCTNTYDPVCGENGITFRNPCMANNVTARVVHRGTCRQGEGMECAFPGAELACGNENAGLYCRDACPNCTKPTFRCTQVGACVDQGDCPAGLKLACDGGTAAFTCVNNQCVGSCG